MDKETSSRVSTVASHVLKLDKYMDGDTVPASRFNDLLDYAQTLAGSAMSQDQTPGQQPLPHGIHPAPAEFTAEQIAADNLLHFFHYAHLPEKLQATSKAFFLLAHHVVVTVPRTPERTVALRKLLEAKDAAVRANLPAPVKRDLPTSEKISTDDSDIEVIEQGGHDQDRDGPIPFDA